MKPTDKDPKSKSHLLVILLALATVPVTLYATTVTGDDLQITWRGSIGIQLHGIRIEWIGFLGGSWKFQYADVFGDHRGRPHYHRAIRIVCRQVEQGCWNQRAVCGWCRKHWNWGKKCL